MEIRGVSKSHGRMGSIICKDTLSRADTLILCPGRTLCPECPPGTECPVTLGADLCLGRAERVYLSCHRVIQVMSACIEDSHEVTCDRKTRHSCQRDWYLKPATGIEDSHEVTWFAIRSQNTSSVAKHKILRFTRWPSTGVNGCFTRCKRPDTRWLIERSPRHRRAHRAFSKT